MKVIRSLKLNSSLLNKILGFIGEVMITGAVVLLLFVFWQQSFKNILVTQEQANTVQNLSKAWGDGRQAPILDQSKAIPNPDVSVALGEAFGVIYIPRLGDGTARVIVNGVDKESILDRGNFGHYSKTQMPGENGNFALAVHRTDWGSPFGDAPKLQIGDQIFIETQNGYYTYVFRNYEFVLPNQTDVLNPVPGQSQIAPGQNILTITTCNPLLGSAERMIVYAVLDSWRTRSEGPPANMNVLPRADVRHDPVSPEITESPSVAEEQLPTAPTSVFASITENWADITWSEPSDLGNTVIESYSLFSSTDGGISWQPIGVVGSDQRSFRADGLLPSTNYFFAVSASSSAGSGPTSIASVTTPSFSPSEPLNFNASVLCSQGNICVISYQFEGPLNPGIGQISYEVGSSVDGGLSWIYTSIASTTGELNYTGPEILIIRAINSYGSSTSNSVDIY